MSTSLGQSSSSRPEGGEKRTKYVAKACQQCRRRKVKCDGRTPQCSRCLQLHDECSYGVGHDKRRSNTLSYVRTLENRIKVLEDLLAKATAAGGPSSDLDLHVVGSGSASDSADDEDDPLYESLATLTLDAETQELKQYGPTSALQLLPPEVRADANIPGIPSPQYNPWTRTMSALPRQLDGSMIDWRRHLPPLEEWDRQLHDSLIDLFFDCFCFYQVVDELAFRNDILLCLSSSSEHPTGDRTSNYSPVLHNALLAVTCELSDDPRAAKEEIGATLLRAAQHELFVEGERPTLSTVQGVLLIGHYFTCVGKHGLGYFYTGIATRMCHTLGLGIDCSAYVAKGLLPKSAQEARNRTFWVCYLYDKLWSSYIGHEPSLTARRTHVGLPEDVASNLAANLDLPFRGLGDPSTPASTTFGWTCRLAILHEQVMNASYGHQRRDMYSTPCLNRVSAVGFELDKWFESLPDNLRIMPQTVKPPPPHVLNLNLYFHFLIILLYRPYYLGSKNEIMDQTATMRCNAATLRTYFLLELFDTQPGLRYAPVTLIQFATMACTTILSKQTQKHASGRQAADVVEAALDIMGLMKKVGRPYRASLQHVAMLENLMSKRAARQSQRTIVPPVSAGETIGLDDSLPGPQILGTDNGHPDPFDPHQSSSDIPMFDFSVHPSNGNGMFPSASNAALLQQPALDSFFQQWGLEEIFGLEPVVPLR